MLIARPSFVTEGERERDCYQKIQIRSTIKLELEKHFNRSISLERRFAREKDRERERERET